MKKTTIKTISKTTKRIDHVTLRAAVSRGLTCCQSACAGLKV